MKILAWRVQVLAQEGQNYSEIYARFYLFCLLFVAIFAKLIGMSGYLVF